MGKRRTLSFLILASLIFVYVIADQWISPREFPDIVMNYSKYQKNTVKTFDNSLNRYIGQCIFYLLGSAIFIITIVAHIRRKELKRNVLITCALYFLIFVALELPLYSWDIGWETVHGHSFWEDFHFH